LNLTGRWREFHNEELYDLYSSSNIIRKGEIGHVARMGEMRKSYKMLVGKPEVIPLWRTRRRWEDNIKVYVKEAVTARTAFS
jgi:hypothetical protein